RERFTPKADWEQLRGQLSEQDRLWTEDLFWWSGQEYAPGQDFMACCRAVAARSVLYQRDLTEDLLEEAAFELATVIEPANPKVTGSALEILAPIRFERRLPDWVHGYDDEFAKESVVKYRPSSAGEALGFEAAQILSKLFVEVDSQNNPDDWVATHQDLLFEVAEQLERGELL